MNLQLEHDLDKGRPLCYKINTYGCQMNAHDSEKIAGMLMNMGYIESKSSNSDSDLVLFNTCCVRDHAEQKVFGNVGALAEAKRINPGMIIAVCGCMMQQKDVADKLQKRFPFIDLIFGTHNLHELPMMLEKLKETKTQQNDVWETDGEIIEDMPVLRNSWPLANINIMYGCNNYCSYCIVPYVRGRERSRKAQDIIDEVVSLAKGGYKEITLLGQNVNSYGKDIDKALDFPALLKELGKIKEIKRIRFMTSHPKDLSDELIDTLAATDNICKQVHLPVQSGDDEVLRAMNREYTSEEYKTLVYKLRSAMPEIGISTDIIVGFPGETEDQFSNTLKLVEHVRFNGIFMFKYSKRDGTKAVKMHGMIPNDTKKRRLDELIRLQENIGSEKNKEYIGRIESVLAERAAKKAGQYCGRTGSGLLVNFSSDESCIGKELDITIEKSTANTLIGSVKDVNI